MLFDFRGCGLSTRGLSVEPLQPEYVVEDAHRLIQALELGSVDLLGFSSGGRAATAFVHRYPSEVSRLFLASSTAYPISAGTPFLDNWAEYQRRLAGEQAAGGRLRNSTIFVWNLELAPSYLRLIDPLDEGDWSYEAFLDGRMHPWVNGDAVDILRRSGKPILILHGLKDMGFPVQLAERLHRAIPGSTLAIIDDAAYMCHLEKPEEWSQQIRHFVANYPQTPE
ncbi:MAG: alpha/beta hydrolase [Microlunatus sp.]|nr:alpha/beta hydrolase [Microlunatus sp.]